MSTKARRPAAAIVAATALLGAIFVVSTAPPAGAARDDTSCSRKWPKHERCRLYYRGGDSVAVGATVKGPSLVSGIWASDTYVTVRLEVAKTGRLLLKCTALSTGACGAGKTGGLNLQKGTRLRCEVNGKGSGRFQCSAD